MVFRATSTSPAEIRRACHRALTILFLCFHGREQSDRSGIVAKTDISVRSAKESWQAWLSRNLIHKPSPEQHCLPAAGSRSDDIREYTAACMGPLPRVVRCRKSYAQRPPARTTSSKAMFFAALLLPQLISAPLNLARVALGYRWKGHLRGPWWHLSSHHRKAAEEAVPPKRGFCLASKIRRL